MISDENDIVLLCQAAVERAQAVDTLLFAGLEALARNIGAYHFKKRIKDPQSIYAKTLRKRREGKADYVPKDMPDCLGYRFIGLFQTELSELSEGLIAHLISAPLRDAWCLQVHTIKLHTNRSEDDPFSLHFLVRDLGERAGASVNVEFNPDRYTSVHFVSSVKLVAQDGLETRTLFEVQVRDLFEEAWSEMSHRLVYKKSDGTINPYGYRHNAIKKILDGVSELAVMHDDLEKTLLSKRRKR